MAKKKFNIDALDEVTGSAALKATPGEQEEEQFKTVIVKDVPASYYAAVKKQRITFTAFVRAAIKEKLERDGMI